MTHCLFTRLLLLLLVVTVRSWADTGPRIPPCEGCPLSPSEFPYPRAGMWYDPARSGTGMSLEVQNRVAVGTWHGFDEDGRPMWYQFAGTLESMPEGEEGYWHLEAPLAQFVGGNCIDCPYRPSEVAGVRGIIRLRVIQRNLISYQLDGGEEYRMLPLVWGTAMPRFFPDVSDHGQPIVPSDAVVSPWLLPPGTTPWVLISRTPAPSNNLYIDSVGTASMSSFTNEPATWYRMSFASRSPNSPEWVERSTVVCGRLSDGVFPWQLPEELSTTLGNEPLCILRRVLGTASFKFYVGPLADVGDDYIRFTARDGSVIEGHRLLYR